MNKFSKSEDAARAFAIRLVPINRKLATWAHELARKGLTVDEIKGLLSDAMEKSGRHE